MGCCVEAILMIEVNLSYVVPPGLVVIVFESMLDVWNCAILKCPALPDASLGNVYLACMTTKFCVGY